MIKKVRNKKIVITLLVLLAIFFAGCKKSEEKGTPPVKKVMNKANVTPNVQSQHTSSQIKIDVSLPVESKDLKDPFKPYVLETKSLSPVSGGHALLPIQNYEVSQFQVLGIITGLKQNSALVVDPTGKAYVVKVGMEIGKNGGKIEKITLNTIEVSEKFLDDNGKIKQRIIKLTLPRKE